jgi:hypothetical protein
MQRLDQQHLDDLLGLQQQKGVLKYVNDYFQAHNLGHLEVTNIRIQPKMMAGNSGPTGLVCGPGKTKMEVCNRFGKCEWVCV